MPIIAIGLALNQTGAFATPGTCNGLSCRLVDRENIQSINSHTRHAITCGPVGNIAADDRVALIFMDYAHRRRLKLLGHMRVSDAAERPDLAQRLAVEGYEERVERFVLITVEAFDWNCPQHITPRFTLAEIEGLVAPPHARIAEPQE